jgi:hypothetical protein
MNSHPGLRFYRSICSSIGASRYATKKPPLQMKAELQRTTLPSLLTSSHVVGSFAGGSIPPVDGNLRLSDL